uniref:Uncharacterized protein n=1 Tax=Attheya septentrionalis TaxID=420275 RepID=A0A7S2XME9_9STRA|mmetsp:Transcript_19190/g.34808  ORF Transcript_19190/g.34808 Transcript_19190/m.34808 type:complete len:750 (+) Transcript_19190:160-2409(+)
MVELESNKLQERTAFIVEDEPDELSRADIVPLSPNLGVQKKSHRFKWIMVMLAVITVVYVFTMVTKTSGEDNNNSNSNIKKRYWFQQGPQDCPAVCAARPPLWRDVDVTTREGLANSLEAAQDTLLDRVKERYGDYYSDIFEVKQSDQKKAQDSSKENEGPPAPVGKTRAKQAFHSVAKSGKEDPSIERLRRRFMKKILEVQIALIKQEGSGSNPCDCSKETPSPPQARTRRALNGEDQGTTKISSYAPMPNYEGNGNADTTDPAYSKLIWALGGHSAAAGHGNLYSQSYTAELERLGRQVFGPLGINFEGRNYAMGSMSSAPEVAMCFKEIFGTDVDIIGWDYGLTDGRTLFKSMLYGNRAALLPTSPILMMMGERYDSVLKKLEEDGMGALVFDDNNFKSMMEGTPEIDGMTEEEIDQVPEAIRYMKCDGKIESGVPCQEKKFIIDGVCPKRKFMTSWHPGHKYHLLMGHVIGLFLIDTMLDAVRELDLLTIGAKKPENILGDLKRKDEMDRDKFERSAPELHGDWIAPGDDKLDINRSLFYRKPNYCHTGLLPSMTRYKGIVTETPDMVGDTDDTFYTALGPLETGNATDIDKPRKWQLQGTPRQVCNVTLVKDFKDTFFARAEDGWMSLTVPNTAELKEYGPYDTQIAREGLVVLCETACDWGKCPPLGINLVDDPFVNNTITMTIDGQPVTRAVVMDRCFFLQGPQGSRWGPGIANKRKNGQYEIKVRVNEEKSFVRISSIIVY